MGDFHFQSWVSIFGDFSIVFSTKIYLLLSAVGQFPQFVFSTGAGKFLQSFFAQDDLAKHQVGTHAKTPSRIENGDLLSSYIQVKPKLVPIARMVVQISPSV